MCLCEIAVNISSEILKLIFAWFQRYCRGFLFSHTYQRKLQSAAVLQSGIRGLIARRNYKRMKIEVCTPSQLSQYTEATSVYN